MGAFPRWHWEQTRYRGALDSGTLSCVYPGAGPFFFDAPYAQPPFVCPVGDKGQKRQLKIL